MKKELSAKLFGELLKLRGAIPRADSYVYSMSESLAETQKIAPPVFIAKHCNYSDINEHGVQLTFCSDHVWGVRTRLNIRLMSKLDKIGKKLAEENSVLLSYADDPNGYQFFLIKDHTQGSELPDLLAVEKELFLLGAGLYTNFLDNQRPSI